MRPRHKATSKGQVTNPQDVRERLGLKPRDEMEFVEDESGYRMQKRFAASLFKKNRGYISGLASHDPDELVEQMRSG